VALAVTGWYGAFPLGSRMLCVARTFLRLPESKAAIERFAATKIRFLILLRRTMGSMVSKFVDWQYKTLYSFQQISLILLKKIKNKAS